MKPVLALLAVLSLTSCQNSDDMPITDFQHLTPRPFGYVIGDEIEHRVMIETHEGARLNQSRLPSQGILNRWLNLNHINVSESPLQDGYRYNIDLRYQVFYAPQATKMLTLPSITLAFTQQEKTIEQTIPAWQFTLSPLSEIQMRKDEHGAYIRPNASTPFLLTPYAIEKLLFSLASLVVSATLLAYFYGYITLPKRKIFQQTQRKLTALNEKQLEHGFRLMHHALNRCHGKPLFSSQLDCFYQKNPAYQSARKLLDTFFQTSDLYFFAGQDVNPDETLQLIKQSCQRCAEIERGQR